MGEKEHLLTEEETTEEAQLPLEPQSKDLDLFNLYLKDIGEIPRLSEEEKKELMLKIREGDKKAKTKYIEANLALVIKIANAEKYAESGVSLSDRIQQGNEGLIKAVRTFDPAKGTKFSTHATKIIENKINSLLDCQDLITVPGTTKRRYRKAVKEELADPESKKKRTGIRQQTIQQIQQASQTHLSLTELENDEEKNTVRSDRIVYPTQEETNWENQITKESLNKLEKTQARVLRLRFGWEDGIIHTQKETAEILGVTYAQVRRLETKAKETMEFYIRLQYLWMQDELF